MFVKKTLKTDSKSGKIYAAYHLVESIRTEKGPRQRTLLYMGTELAPSEGVKNSLHNVLKGLLRANNPYCLCGRY